MLSFSKKTKVFYFICGFKVINIHENEKKLIKPSPILESTFEKMKTSQFKL